MVIQASWNKYFQDLCHIMLPPVPTPLLSAVCSRTLKVLMRFRVSATLQADRICVSPVFYDCSYSLVVEMGMIFSCLQVYLLLYAYLWLRVKDPELERPYRVSGGIWGAIFTSVFPLGAITFNL